MAGPHKEQEQEQEKEKEQEQEQEQEQEVGAMDVDDRESLEAVETISADKSGDETARDEHDGDDEDDEDDEDEGGEESEAEGEDVVNVDMITIPLILQKEIDQLALRIAEILLFRNAIKHLCSSAIATGRISGQIRQCGP